MLNMGDAWYESKSWQGELARVQSERALRPVRRRYRAGRQAGLGAGYRRLMAGLGSRMVDLGCALESRYVVEGPGDLVCR
jgi:hypothetical protein